MGIDDSRRAIVVSGLPLGEGRVKTDTLVAHCDVCETAIREGSCVYATVVEQRDGTLRIVGLTCQSDIGVHPTVTEGFQVDAGNIENVIISRATLVGVNCSEDFILECSNPKGSIPDRTLALTDAKILRIEAQVDI